MLVSHYYFYFSYIYNRLNNFPGFFDIIITFEKISEELLQSFHTNITASVTKSPHQDRGPCNLHLHIFFSYIYTLLFCWKIKSCCDRCFPQQITPQITVQLYIYTYIYIYIYSARIDFNMINNRHTRDTSYSIQHVSLNPWSFDSLNIVLLWVKRSMW